MKSLFWAFAFIIFSPLEAKKKDTIEPKLVDIHIVNTGSIQKEFRVIGTIHATLESPGVARADGILNHIKRTGESVKADEVYAEILHPEINKRYLLAKQDEKIAKKHRNRMARLYKKGGVSESQYEKAKQSWLEKKKLRLEIKNENAQFQLKAPFTGILGSYLVPEGYSVKAGQHVVTVFNPSQLEVHFNIPAHFIHQLHQGMKIRLGNHIYELPRNLQFIHEATQSIPIYLKIKTHDYYLGEMVDVFLIEQEKKDIIVIPSTAVFIENNRHYVYRIRKDHTLEKVLILLGLETKDKVEVTQGLRSGDKIIPFNPTRFSEMQVVRFHNDGAQ